MFHNERSYWNEKPVPDNWRVAPTRYNYRKALAATKTQHSQKINKEKKKSSSLHKSAVAERFVVNNKS